MSFRPCAPDGRWLGLPVRCITQSSQQGPSQTKTALLGRGQIPVCTPLNPTGHVEHRNAWRVCMHVRVCMCKCGCECVHVCVSTSVHLCKCECVHVSVIGVRAHVCRHLCTCECASVHVLCMYTCACMLCVHVHVCA